MLMEEFTRCTLYSVTRHRRDCIFGRNFSGGRRKQKKSPRYFILLTCFEGENLVILNNDVFTAAWYLCLFAFVPCLSERISLIGSFSTWNVSVSFSSLSFLRLVVWIKSASWFVHATDFRESEFCGTGVHQFYWAAITFWCHVVGTMLKFCG